MPKSFGDRIPQSKVGAILSLADKIDNIVSFFSIGLIPTGAEDPFALRRQAMGIVSIFLEKGYALGLQDVFGHALSITCLELHPLRLSWTSITNFMNQRTEFILYSAGHNQEVIRSVLQLSFIHPLRGIIARIKALEAVQKEETFSEFLLAMALIMGALNTRRIFFVPSLAPAALNIIIIIFVLVFAARLEQPIFAVACGVALGGLVQFAFQLPSFFRSGYSLHPDFHFRHAGLRKMAILMIPATMGMAVAQINIFVSTILASYLPEGSITYLYYSMRLIQFPVGIFGVAMGMAVLPA